MPSKLEKIAKAFFFAQRTFEKLTASVTGVPMIKEYNIMHIPVMGDLVSNQHAIAMLEFDDPTSADQICDLLNSHLRDAAISTKSKHLFYGMVRHHGRPMMDRIVFMRDDHMFFPLSALSGHLEEVQKHIDKIGRTLAQQVRQRQNFANGPEDRTDSMQCLNIEKPFPEVL